MAVDALNGLDPKDPDSLALTKAVLRTLRASFEHDQDGKLTGPEIMGDYC